VRERLLREFKEHASAEFAREAEMLSAALREIFGIYEHATLEEWST
jgi:hypothetical protein